MGAYQQTVFAGTNYEEGIWEIKTGTCGYRERAVPSRESKTKYTRCLYFSQIIKH